MCKLVTIENSNGAKIEVADIKAEIIKKIISLAHSCDKIDYIYVFGSTVEESCTSKSDIDIAIISNVTRSKLFQTKSYNEFTNELYNIDLNQEYDILQFNSLDAIKNSEDFVCRDILDKGKLLYERKRA
ncbi:MAG: nucleotidyltransferase domain-containing protein [Lachnospiraceae bacterium]|nr:nucleotidyltransferase domain-containing protein [Lachnospiraceae bacterium]